MKVETKQQKLVVVAGAGGVAFLTLPPSLSLRLPVFSSEWGASKAKKRKGGGGGGAVGSSGSRKIGAHTHEERAAAAAPKVGWRGDKKKKEWGAR